MYGGGIPPDPPPVLELFFTFRQFALLIPGVGIVREPSTACMERYYFIAFAKKTLAAGSGSGTP